MRNILTCILICCFTATTQIWGQSLQQGIYSLNDGGVDMPSSQLVILANNEFYIGSAGIVLHGICKEQGHGEWQLKPDLPTKKAIEVFGSTDLNKSKSNFEFNDFDNNNSISVAFTKDSLELPKFNWVFERGRNVYLSGYYSFDIAKDKCRRLYVAVPDVSKTNLDVTKYPYDAVVYVFNLPSKYQHFDLYYNGDVQNYNYDFILKVKNGVYFLNDRKLGERQEIPDNFNDIIRAIKNQAVRDDRASQSRGTALPYIQKLSQRLGQPAEKPLIETTEKE